MTIGVYTNLCEEDAHWAPQWLREVERLGLEFVVHLDRCSPATRVMFIDHPQCVGHTINLDKEYTEQAKQGGMDILMEKRYDWAMLLDIDETWERDAPEKLRVLERMTEDYVRVAWVNTWGDEFHIRVDDKFSSSRRPKFYNLRDGRRWYFDHPITYGCKMTDVKGRVLNGFGVMGESDLVCLHHGLRTRELREFHKARWDRIYTAAVGNNPYGFWNHCLDEKNHPPTVIPNPYL